MTVDYESGELYSGEAYLGNIHLNGKSPSNINEAGAKTTFGAPLKAPKRNYLYLLRSSDNGKTWSKPKDITGQVLIKQDGTFLGVAPGVGLTTHKGRVIMPLYVDRKQTVSIYSIDDGENWHRMALAPFAIRQCFRHKGASAERRNNRAWQGKKIRQNAYVNLLR